MRRPRRTGASEPGPDPTHSSGPVIHTEGRGHSTPPARLNGPMTTESPAPTLPDHEIPTLSLDELRHLQTERLRERVSAAYANVPHYKAAFDAKGVTPDDITSL